MVDPLTGCQEWVVWDWNGTLLDDTVAALNAFNVQLLRRGLPPITFDFYRDHFAFPVKPFYALCGVDLAREDWDELAHEYHRSYAAEPKALNVEAVAALEAVRARGARQCVLSALRQDLLDAALTEHGIRPYFDYVYGVDNLDGGSKLERARELFAHLAADASPYGPARITLIGDAIHDAEVAKALGVNCVLVATGGHSAARLRAVAPTADTLLQAIRAVGRENLV